ncbi:terminase large subunit [Paraburkholderia tuberum]|uniref:Phage terminase-like protein, large subunit, contains N-terminal HTH domain n=1 Tax=Paraburkholderia tuberum TaxID=157910 RepID=A0A1H1JB94_9BURK|nr:terminase large subunit [Paraburkholderia tuberum]SDR47163.1 Phage terminase-like protein, large subunit, contains N-terminal HTH domain [Paraburkholderia tuberum]
MEWSTACPDWAERLKTGRSIIPPPIFPEQAEQALAVFKELKIVDAPGSPTFGESSAQWVFDLVASIFGAYDAENGRRLITEWFVCIPKKNSKSTLAAGIMMTAMILNWRMSAEYAILAPTIEVANNSFAPSRDMVKHEDELDDLFQVQAHIKTITHRTSGAMLKVVAADSNTVSGKKSVGTLIDELWLFGKQPDAEDMLREATGGLASRPEGFVIYLTTQSNDPPAGVFLQKLRYARDVRDGKIVDPCFVPVIFEHPPEMIASKEHLKVENLAMVNPNFGFSVDQAYLEREFRKAKETGEESFRGFLAKHANVEIGLALRSDRWAGADFWEGAARGTRTLDELLARCEVVDVGIDGGGLDDLLGFAVVGRERGTGNWLAWSHAWAHPSVLERRKSEAARFNDFSDDGDLTLVEHIGEDVADVADLVSQCESSGLLDKVGVDPAGIGAVLDALVDAGVPEDKVIGISQGWKLGGAIKTTERRIAEGALLHGGQRMMAWCVGNARVEPRGNAILITKQASGSAKIDPLMALFNAVSLISLNPQAGFVIGSDYEFVTV